MKIINTVGAQGDVLFRRVDALPPNAVEQKREATPEGWTRVHD